MLFIYSLIFLLSCSFFVAAEEAFWSTNRLKIELDKARGSFIGNIWGIFYKDEDRFYVFLKIATISSIVGFVMSFGMFVTADFIEFNDQYRGLFITFYIFICILIVIIFGLLLPKSLIRSRAHVFMKYGSPLLFLSFCFFFVPTVLLSLTRKGFLAIFNIKTEKSENNFSKSDLEEYVNEMTAILPEEQEFSNEISILQNALDFSEVRARNCMIPLGKVIAIEINEDINDLKALFIEHGLSKIIVYRDGIDNIVGYVHSFEMFKKPSQIKQILLPIPFVPEAISGNELLELFSKKSNSIAVVVDEYGGTAGIITLEDVIEEIIGEIEDEHDFEEEVIEKIDEKTYLFNADIEVEIINKNHGLQLPVSEEYETLAGLILHHLASIPERNSEIKINEYILIVEDVQKNKIETVVLKIV